MLHLYVVVQLSSRTRHRVLAVAALDSDFVDLWQSLSEWHLLLSACVFLWRRENVGV